MRIFIVILAVLLLPASASAQQYQQWNNPDQQTAPADDARLRDFTERLNGLIDKAEKDRAADPRFLQDLRDLANGVTGETNTPSSRQLLSDDFGDGDFTHNPVWTVAQGKYWVEKGWGLRSAVKKKAAQEPQRRSGKDAAAAIFGQILQRAIDPEGKSASASSSGERTSSAGTPAAIRTAVMISNAFRLEMEFSSWVAPGAAPGRLEIAVYQNTTDYILAYQPGGAFELVRASPRGSNVIDSQTGPSLENKKTHLLVWTRETDGRMRVTIDGQEVLTTNDRSTYAPFDGLRIVNRGGDYIIKRISVSETRR